MLAVFETLMPTDGHALPLHVYMIKDAISHITLEALCSLTLGAKHTAILVEPFKWIQNSFINKKCSLFWWQCYLQLRHFEGFQPKNIINVGQFMAEDYIPNQYYFLVYQLYRIHLQACSCWKHRTTSFTCSEIPVWVDMFIYLQSRVLIIFCAVTLCYLN